MNELKGGSRRTPREIRQQADYVSQIKPLNQWTCTSEKARATTHRAPK